MSDKHKYIELVPSTVLPTLRGEDGNNYIKFETHLRIVNEIYDRLNKQGHETARILNLCDEKDIEIEKHKRNEELYNIKNKLIVSKDGRISYSCISDLDEQIKILNKAIGRIEETKRLREKYGK